MADDLQVLRERVDKARRVRDSMRAEMEWHDERATKAWDVLREAGIDPDKDIQAQLVSLNKRAVKATDDAMRIIAELEDALR